MLATGDPQAAAAFSMNITVPGQKVSVRWPFQGKTSPFQNHTAQNLRRQLHFKVHTGNLELKKPRVPHLYNFKLW
jgi:hypothetical protein